AGPEGGQAPVQAEQTTVGVQEVMVPVLGAVPGHRAAGGLTVPALQARIVAGGRERHPRQRGGCGHACGGEPRDGPHRAQPRGGVAWAAPPAAWGTGSATTVRDRAESWVLSAVAVWVRTRHGSPALVVRIARTASAAPLEGSGAEVCVAAYRTPSGPVLSQAH